MKKSTIFKLIAVVLCIGLLFSNLLHSVATQSTTPATVPAANSGLDPIYSAANTAGYYLGSQTTAPGNDFDFRNGNGSHYSATVKAEAAPSVTAVGMGHNGSAALKVGYNKAYNRYLFRYYISSSYRTTTIKANETYTIEMKVKPVSGSVSGIYTGFYYNYDQIPADIDNAQYTTAENYDSSDLAADKWTTITFTRSCPNAVRWIFINITSADQNGGVLLIDDLKIYAANDASKTNLLTSDVLVSNKDADNKEVPLVAETANIGSFDIFKGYAFDNTPYTDTSSLLPISNAGVREATIAPYISAKGEGVKGGYAFNIPVNDKFKNSISFQGANRSNKQLSLYWDTTYTVELKVRVKSGSIKSFNAGIYELYYAADQEMPGVPNGKYIDDKSNKNYGKWVYDSYKNYGLSLAGSELSSEWQYYVFEVTTNKNNKNWKRIVIDIEGNSADTVVQIDDLKIAVKGDTSGNYITYQDNSYGYIPADGSFETFRNPFRTTTVDNTPVNGTKYVPYKLYDWTLAYNGTSVITRADNTAVPRIYNNSNIESRTATKPRISGLGDGVKGSYALLLGDKNTPNIKDYEVGFYYTTTGAFVPNTEYTFSVKLKKRGNIDNFRIGYKNLNGAGTEYSLELTNEDFDQNGGWLEYTWNYTTNSETTVHYGVIFFAYASATGGEVYVDDMTIYETLGIDTRNLFGWSTFDYTDLGQDKKVTFESSFPKGQTPDFRASAKNNKDSSGNGIVARVESYKDAKSGNGVLAFGFDKNKGCDVRYLNTLVATQPGRDYKVSFWVKVQGEVTHARVGYGDSWQKNRFYSPGYSFNQYEQGKWTYVEFTVNDPGDYPSNAGYRRLVIEFKAPAGSGMLIDDLRVIDVNYPGKSPNLTQYGTFERIDNGADLVWSDAFITKKEGN